MGRDVVRDTGRWGPIGGRGGGPSHGLVMTLAITGLDPSHNPGLDPNPNLDFLQARRFEPRQGRIWQLGSGLGLRPRLGLGLR